MQETRKGREECTRFCGSFLFSSCIPAFLIQFRFRVKELSREDHSFHLEGHLREVQQQAVLPVCGFEVGANNCEVNVFQVLDGLQLDHDGVVHEQVQLVTADFFTV